MMKLTVARNRLGPVLGRHPWVFSGALKNIPEGLKSGEPVSLVDEQGKFLAGGYFNSYSQIAVRVWSWQEEEINDYFFSKRIEQAYNLRKRFVENKKTDSYRLFYSENDFLPGLIVDKYGDYLSVQFHNRGIEMWKEQIVSALIKVVKPKGIYERSDVGGRLSEGMAKKSGLLYGEMPEKVKILENGYKFWVDIIGGQKTGFFLDQRDKRQALEKYCAGKSVLNCFSYTGGFSLYALGGGAKKVVSVDASESALKLAEENLKLNKFDAKKCDFVQADVKEYLAQPDLEKFDVIVLDPPAFVKDRHKINEGLQGYRKINEMALKSIVPGGILVSASCSIHVTLRDFRFALSEASARAGRTLQILETYTHGIDHPELVAFIEGEYLKCLFALVN